MHSGLKFVSAAAGLLLASACDVALAQSAADATTTQTPTTQGQAPRTLDKSGQSQPQGHPGPTETSSGGAPAASPQGETPPGMQSPTPGSPSADPKER